MSLQGRRVKVLSEFPFIKTCMHAKSLQLCLTLCDPVDGSHQAPLSMGFSRQEYWSRLPCLPPGDLPHSEIKPASPALAGGFFTTEPAGKPRSSQAHHFLLPAGFGHSLVCLPDLRPGTRMCSWHLTHSMCSVKVLKIVIYLPDPSQRII